MQRFKTAVGFANGFASVIVHPLFYFRPMIENGAKAFESLNRETNDKLSNRHYKQYLGRLMDFVKTTNMPIFWLHGEVNPFNFKPQTKYADKYFADKLCALVRTDIDVVPQIRAEEDTNAGWDTFRGILNRIEVKNIHLSGELLCMNNGNIDGCVQHAVTELSPYFKTELHEELCFPGSKKWALKDVRKAEHNELPRAFKIWRKE